MAQQSCEFHLEAVFWRREVTDLVDEVLVEPEIWSKPVHVRTVLLHLCLELFDGLYLGEEDVLKLVLLQARQSDLITHAREPVLELVHACVEAQGQVPERHIRRQHLEIKVNEVPLCPDLAHSHHLGIRTLVLWRCQIEKFGDRLFQLRRQEGAIGQDRDQTSHLQHQVVILGHHEHEEGAFVGHLD